MKRIHKLVTLSLLAFCGALQISQAVQSVNVLQKIGDPIPGFAGYTASFYYDYPTINGLGQTGFHVEATNGIITRSFIWFNGGTLLDNNSVPGVTNALQDTLGFSNNGNFIYSPRYNFGDSLFNESGLIIAEDDPIGTQFVSAASRCYMRPDGTAYYVVSLSNAPNGPTVDRIFYKRNPSGAVTELLRTGDIVDGLPLIRGSLSNLGLSLYYEVSDNNSFIIQNIVRNTLNPLNDGAVFSPQLGILRREGDADGSGFNFSFFRGLDINNSGNYVFMGENTSTSVPTNSFLANQDGVAVREGGKMDNTILATSNNCFPRSVSINNQGLVAHTWGPTNISMLFIGNVNHLQASRLIMKSGDPIDLDGDWIADATLVDIRGTSASGSSPSMQIAENGTVSMRIIYRTIGSTINRDAMVEVPLAKQGDADLDNFVGLDDFNILSDAFNSSPDDLNWEANADFDFDGFVGLDDFNILSNNFNT